jgi:SDR family mycofactocin-dependent oxidoreductase
VGLLDGKVALVSGAARGQGRSHAVRLAEEGADIIAFDICTDIDSSICGLGTWEELSETAQLVEKHGRRVVRSRTDARDAEAVRAAVDAGVAELGRLDIVVANAGITAYKPVMELTEQIWRDVIDVDLTGAWNTARASLRHILNAGQGGSIVFISSSAALVGCPNLAAYSAAKAGLVGLMQSMAVELGPQRIRVNTIHPTGVDTPMLQNNATYGLFVPDADLSNGVDDATMERFRTGIIGLNSLPIPWVDPIDISNAVVYLVSDQGRYVSGTQLRVDAACAAK